MNLENTKAQMKKGLLELCTLSIIKKEEAYPSDIIKELKKAQLIVKEGTMYPLLNRLMKEDLLSYNWKESKSGPPRKYYTITEKGNQFHQELLGTWDHLQSAINNSIKNHK